MGADPTVRNDRGESPLDVASTAQTVLQGEGASGGGAAGGEEGERDADTALAMYLSSESQIVEMLGRQKEEQKEESIFGGASPVFATGSRAREGGIIKQGFAAGAGAKFPKKKAMTIKLKPKAPKKEGATGGDGFKP